MSGHFDRAQLLMAQGRASEAEAALREALADDAEDPASLILLAMALKDQHRLDEADVAATQAIALAPDAAFGHFTRGAIALERDDWAAAEEAAETAVLLDPTLPQSHALLSAARLGLRRWAEALEAAEEALRLDPAYEWANNLRAQLLIKLGRNADARAAMASNLAQHPDEATTHANQGWVLLQTGDPAGALTHFEEALRLDPTLDWAREGVITALKARHWPYRLVFAFFVQMGRLGRGQQWLVILVGFFGVRALRQLAQHNPALAPFIWPIVGLYLVFVVLTWVADPLFNLVLRLNRYGRLVLSEQEVQGSTIFGGVLAAAVALGLVGLLGRPVLGGHGAGVLLLAGFICAGMLLPVSAAVGKEDPAARKKLTTYTGVLAALGVATVLGTALHASWTSLFAITGAVAFFAFQFYANRLAIHGKA